MDIYLLNTAEGLKPYGDSAYEAKMKLKIGEVYKATIKKPRNLKLHKKYFALIHCAWAFLKERQTAFFHENVEVFRKTVEVAAGHCDKVYNVKHKEWVDVPRSIAFDKMDEAEFSDLYERVKDVLFEVFLKDITEEEFMDALLNF